MPEQWYQREVQSSIRYARIWCEDGKDTSQCACNEERLLVKANSKAGHVRRRVQPEDAEKELSERIEHLNEEVPPQTNVWCEIWKEKTHAVRRGQKVP
jgi:hypothetical protein